MANNLKPRLVLFQSTKNLRQYFYCVLMDLPFDPDNPSQYPDPSSIVPTIVNNVLTYTTNDYDLPASTDGTTKTYLLTPYMALNADGITTTPNITHVSFKAKSTDKKSDTSGIKTNQLPWTGGSVTNVATETTTPAPAYYDCSGRQFVIESETNPGTYFVGALAEFPSNEIAGPASLVNVNELKSEKVPGTNPASTCIIYSSIPGSYDGESDPKTATYIAVFVDNPTKGILLYGGIDMYRPDIVYKASLSVATD